MLTFYICLGAVIVIFVLAAFVPDVMYALRFLFGIPGVFVASAVKLVTTLFHSLGLIYTVAKDEYDSEESRAVLTREDASLYGGIDVLASVPEIIVPAIKKVPRLRMTLRYAMGIPGAVLASVLRFPAILINGFILLPEAVGRKYDDALSFLLLSREQQFLYKWISGFCGIPNAIISGAKKAALAVWHGLCAVYRNIADIVITAKKGSPSTLISYVLMGYGNIARGQILRGVLFMLFEAVFIFYMIFAGAHWLSYLPSLGKQGPVESYDFIADVYTTTRHDNSFKILLYGVLTLFFIVAFIYTWRLNIKQNKLLDEFAAAGKKAKGSKDDLRSLVDENFHRTLLSLPTLGILLFTVLPIFFMILVAFTNYDNLHDGYTNALFKWVGTSNFKQLFSWEAKDTKGTTLTFSATFGEVLSWTLIWAFFATFTTYFLGMLVAMAINKKGIRFKKGWRTILVLTIAIPQFISLLYVSRMFAYTGIINNFLKDLGLRKNPIDFWGTGTSARITAIAINIWIGIPYVMLITTGILMNIPQDLYESSRIDGAGGWQQYTKITLPYMLFVTGPYLLTSFTGNINNFNVIFLLTGGGPNMTTANASAGSIGQTDLLITWLYKLTTGTEPKYYLASVIGIMIFVVLAIISLAVYRMLPSVKNEEDFQ